MVFSLSKCHEVVDISINYMSLETKKYLHVIKRRLIIVNMYQKCCFCSGVNHEVCSPVVPNG